MKLIDSILKYTLCTALLFSSACGDFGDMNVDPNRPTQPLTSALLTDAQRSMSSVIGAADPVLYVQHLSQTQYTEASRYQTVNFDFNAWYSGPLVNLQRIIELNTDEETRNNVLANGSNANQIAAARIMKAYYFHFMTDRWGMLPYSESLQGRQNFTPGYDTQEEIYNDLFKELREAVAMIDDGPGVAGDILFGGDMEQWARFANTLRMTMALRLSDVAPSVAETEFAAAYNGGVLEEDLAYPYLNETNNQNPWYERFITRTDYAVSEPLVDYMKELQDPRLPAYADPAVDLISEEGYDVFKGMPYGIEAAGDIENSSISFMSSDIIANQDAPLYIYTRSQILFSVAEAIVRGWVSGDAEQTYYDAIQASMEQWGVFGQTSVMKDMGQYHNVPTTVEVDIISFEEYIAQPQVAWSEANAIEKIQMQKWVALYLQGYEAWAEWRRTDLPSLAPAPDALNDSRRIPVRHAYPTSERDINTANYDEAVSTQGADNLDTPLWWDVD